MKNQIIIALYKENINWIQEIIDKYDIFIYHKDNKIPKNLEYLIKNKKIKYEQLNNVGRESHTYFYHIIKNIDNLPEKIFFTQAEPFDHIKEDSDYASNEFFFDILVDFFEGDYDFRGYGKKYFIWKKGIGNKTSIMEKIWNDLFDSPLEEFYFNNGGIFGVKKENVLFRNKDFYKYALKSLEYHKNPTEGFCYERLWTIIFNKNYKTKFLP